MGPDHTPTQKREHPLGVRRRGHQTPDRRMHATRHRNDHRIPRTGIRDDPRRTGRGRQRRQRRRHGIRVRPLRHQGRRSPTTQARRHQQSRAPLERQDMDRVGRAEDTGVGRGAQRASGEPAAGSAHAGTRLDVPSRARRPDEIHDQRGRGSPAGTHRRVQQPPYGNRERGGTKNTEGGA